jgi:proteic killer suppression protein
MQIYFRTKKLQKQCSSEAEMLKAFGKKRAERLQQRLMELRAATTLSDVSRLPPARCHELTGNLKGILSVDLDHPYRLLFIPADDPVPRLSDGGLDWDNIRAVEIQGIEDTH